MSHRMVNVAHRGASATRPENTLAAFRRAIEVGADMIELDARATADGVAVVMHDGAVDRTTNGSGPLANLTLKRVKALDAGSWFAEEFAGEPVPTLTEVVSLTAGRIALDIELKETGFEQQAVEALRRAGNGWSFISSFNDGCLKRVREIDAGVRTGLIVAIGELSDGQITELIERTRGLGASILAALHSGITPALVEAANAADISLVAWTVDRRDDMRRMMDLGITGIATNYPEVLQDMLERGNV
ncbi:MAG: glycerophosphodiester phosphodiesterase [Armatimonadota bacterium]|nr:MAG: glycerophosphodiester phosphodiesterase [Armatimonadota bacterium]